MTVSVVDRFWSSVEQANWLKEWTNGGKERKKRRVGIIDAILCNLLTLKYLQTFYDVLYLKSNKKQWMSDIYNKGVCD